MLSVIIPVHNGGQSLTLCLEGLARSSRLPDETIVVDDVSTDGTGDLARRMGATVIRLHGSPHGPAHARNRGAEVAQGDLLVFVDADVVVHSDVLERLEMVVRENPGVAGFFGSYDDDPPERGLVTRYKNLLHHYVHQHGRREASTFWAGFGALRRDAFEAVGGFDASYAVPSIEDIELGGRLRAAGFRIWLCPDLQVTHLKRWTLGSLLRTDIVCRAVPWTQLMVSRRHVVDDLNLDGHSRASAVLAWTLLPCLALAVWLHSVWVTVLAVSLALGLLVLNWGLYVFFVRRGGPCFAAGAVVLHTTYLLYSSAVFGAIVALAWLRRFTGYVRG